MGNPGHNRIYGAIAYLPLSPASDLHGLVRLACAAPNTHRARSLMRRAGAVRLAFLAPSRSIQEREAVQVLAGGEGDGKGNGHGVACCSLTTCYLHWKYWSLIR